jgi:hypothetical protein
LKQTDPSNDLAKVVGSQLLDGGFDFGNGTHRLG